MRPRLQLVEDRPLVTLRPVFREPWANVIAWWLIFGALVVGMLAGCGWPPAPEVPRPAALPPAPSVGASLHPWCPACADLPNLGREPRVSRSSPLVYVVERD